MSCLFPDKPDFCVVVAFIPALLTCVWPWMFSPAVGKWQREMWPPSSRIRTITHFQRGCTGCILLLPPPPAILSHSAPLLTVGMRDKRSPSRMGPNESFIWCVLRRRCVAVPLLSGRTQLGFGACAFSLVSASGYWGRTKWTEFEISLMHNEI